MATPPISPRVSTPPAMPGALQIDEPEAAEDDQQQGTEMPLTMAASVILTNLPRDATSALQGAGDLPQEKVTVRLLPVGSAPTLKQSVFKVSSTQSFSTVISFVRKRIGSRDREGVFCYVNSTFSPQPDENVGNLWRCFKTGTELHVNYAKMQAFG